MDSIDIWLRQKWVVVDGGGICNTDSSDIRSVTSLL